MTRLPMFERGPGPRRDDCRRYESCLHRWVMRSDRRPQDHYEAAQCPAGCAFFAPVDRGAIRDHEATRRESHG